jgi:hypothetical protein
MCNSTNVLWLFLLAWNDWTSFGWVQHLLQACQARSPRYWCHSQLSLHPIEVNCSWFVTSRSINILLGLKTVYLFYLLEYIPKAGCLCFEGLVFVICAELFLGFLVGWFPLILEFGSCWGEVKFFKK